MVLQVAYRKPKIRRNTARRSTVATLPAPIGGWNTRDSPTNMPTKDALILDNWFPDISHVQMRQGYESHCDTATTTRIDTLHEHVDDTNRQLLAFTGGKIFNASTSTAASLKTGLANNRWTCVNFKQVSVMVNGSDTPQQYNGTTVSNATYTGISDPTVLVGVTVFKERLFFWENSSASFWYAQSRAISGVLSEYPLSMVGTKGGVVVGIATWSVDTGAGPDDLLCIFLSGGFVVIYSGSNPGDATQWGIVGIYNIGQPVHQRAIVKYGSDLLIVTREGYDSLSNILKDELQVASAALSDKISHTANEVVRDHFSNFGWQIQPYPQGKYIIFNVPKTSVTFTQHVMNIRTKAWCSFSAQNGSCWALFNGGLYFGGQDGIVYHADTGTSDNGTAITADARTSWNYFGKPGQLKRWTGTRFQLSASGTINYTYRQDYDFRLKQDTGASGAASVLASGTGDVDGPAWNTTPWDEANWASESPVTMGWKSAAGFGIAASTRLRISNATLNVSWLGTQHMIEPGGLL